ncbi:MAG TPA: zinc metalloprotease [Gaiellaceae bacterium]|nr:zinc metalloprotease [Gaiellaceae bacterium]
MRKLIVLAAGSLAALAVTAAPVGAAAGANPALCTGWEAAGTGTFDSLTSLTTSSSSARSAGNVVREPSLNATYEAMPASAKGKGGSKFKATVPVWFHVVSDGAIGNVTQAQIDEQMTVLNLAFAGFYGGAKSGFRFELAGVTRTDNADWFYGGIDGSSERPMKRALHRGGFETLNVYSTTAGAYLGWAYLPGLPDSNLYLDGIVFDWESMVETSDTYAGRYDLGMTLVHEAGHWVNLEHTFYGGCNAKGDFVDDTPPMKVPTSGCPEGKDTCSEPGLDPIHNYMDYSYDSCYDQFTAGQVARAQDAWLYYRAT